ncbi:MAG: hypothetical protein INH37_13735 [Myxococcaceae bacterium]|nr:hypothetical protein [Myxococcaceae bacterium]
MNAVIEHQLDFGWREDPLVSRAIRVLQQGYPLPVDMQSKLLDLGIDVGALTTKYQT